MFVTCFKLYFFLKNGFFDILFIKVQAIFINFPIPQFLAKKFTVKIKHSQQHIDLSHARSSKFVGLRARLTLFYAKTKS